MLHALFLRPQGVTRMELKVKLQKHTNKKQKEKRKLNRINGRELYDDKLSTINFLYLALHFNSIQKIYQNYLLKLNQYCIKL